MRWAGIALLAVACTGGGDDGVVRRTWPAAFTEAVRLDATHLRLTFTTGGPGCSVLDRVEVTGSGDALAATLYVGNDLPDGVDGCSSIGREAYAVAEVPAAPRATRITDASRGVAVPIS